MKQIIFPFLLLLFAAAVIAIPVPHPVYGFITNDGDAVKGIDVIITYVPSGYSDVIETNNNGEYLRIAP